MENLRVQIGSVEHYLPIVVSLFFIVNIIILAKRVEFKVQWQLIQLLSVNVSGFTIFYHLHKIYQGNYSLQTDLPLYLCSLLAILVPIFTFSKKYWMFEILLFWIIAGTLQGTITPDIAVGYPSLDYFRYWIVHLGLLGIISYIIFVFKWKPKLRSVWKSYLALQIYFVSIWVINELLGSNYFYLNQKPQSASLLDYLGDWPWYIINVQLLVIPLFLLIYLPFYLLDQRTISQKAG